ncbi:nitronate monooxygenase [Phanerochaete sordida]|uniref:Nitronate monooxygenase n=1 Tax=Phanerochaete sordida TaxID=48140 RepID=A0A9P3GMI3_9APHY|nr:nitronate monooxygenase [Phanerochaete sordida]
MPTITTPVTELFKIQHPIICAGMDRASGPELAAAVTNAGGLGCLGGIRHSPEQLREAIRKLKSKLANPNALFGVDLLIAQVGGNARKTNYDYNKGRLAEYIDLLIEEKVALFVCAVGVPPQWVVERLHGAGILVMNMVGHPKHVAKALQSGVDLICAQAGEAGGHTGDVPASLLVPACADAIKGHKSPLTGKQIGLVGAGAIYDGRGLAANLAWGAQAVWVGTRFVASVEAGAPQVHKNLVVKAGWEDTARTLIFTGRPARVFKTPYVRDWEENRQAEIKDLTSRGIVPADGFARPVTSNGMDTEPYPMGRVAAVIDEILPAKTIVEKMVREAVEVLRVGGAMVTIRTKL